MIKHIILYSILFSAGLETRESPFIHDTQFFKVLSTLCLWWNIINSRQLVRKRNDDTLNLIVFTKLGPPNRPLTSLKIPLTSLNILRLSNRSRPHFLTTRHRSRLVLSFPFQALNLLKLFRILFKIISKCHSGITLLAVTTSNFSKNNWVELWKCKSL